MEQRPFADRFVVQCRRSGQPLEGRRLAFTQFAQRSPPHVADGAPFHDDLQNFSRKPPGDPVAK
jgi:hypothetical protein